MIPVHKEILTILDSSSYKKGNFGLWFNKFVELDERNNFKVPTRAVNEYKDKYKEIVSYLKDFLLFKHINQYLFCQSFSSRYETLVFVADLKSPLIVGIGETHPSEVSMIFDHNLGIPYVPASSIKGVVRFAYMLELLDKGIDENKLKQDKEGSLYIDEEEEWTNVPDIFGTGGDDAKRGKVIFLDSYPLEVPHLHIDIMNPHYGPYYTDEGHKTPPADYHQPNPIKFLTVAKGSKFIFRVLIDKTHNKYDELKSKTIKALKRAITEEGVGAKTSLGYGLFKIVSEKEPSEIIKVYQEKFMSEEDRLKQIKEGMLAKIDKLPKGSQEVDAFIQEWQRNEKLNKDKEIAEKLIPKVRKKKKNKQYTKSYKILADILGISLE